MRNSVAIITINLNNLEGLKKTMTSVFDQSFTDYEYIVIDGGSTDGSKEYIEQHSDKLTYWLSEKDNGIYQAMNKGIKRARGEYLLFLNSGDFLYNKTVLSNFVQSVGEKGLDVYYGNLKVIYPDGRRADFIGPSRLTLDYLLSGTLFHPATFIKRSLFWNFGFYDERFKIAGDWEFFFRVIAKENATFSHFNKFISVYHKDGVSSDPVNLPVIEKEKQWIVKRNVSNLFSKVLDERKVLEEENWKLKKTLASKRKLLGLLRERIKEDMTRLFRKLKPNAKVK